jgi:phosphoglycerate dehydrogenase-like enzyme
VRVHVQSVENDTNGIIRSEQWQSVFGDEHEVSFGITREAFTAVEGEIEALVIATRAVRQVLPILAPKLELISVTSAGLDMLLPLDWLPIGVTLLNNSGAHAVKAGEYVIMALLMLANHMPRYFLAQHDRDWRPEPTTTLAGKRLTIVGLGAMGERAAVLANSLGLNVVGFRSQNGEHPACERVLAIDALDEVLPNTDYLVLALPGGETTRGLISRERLTYLPKHAGVINVGRGSVLDEAALCDLLDAGRLGGAVLDVFENEPLDVQNRIWSTRNLIATPHVSADDPITYHLTTLQILRENLLAYQLGTPMPNRINLATGQRYSAHERG